MSNNTPVLRPRPTRSQVESLTTVCNEAEEVIKVIKQEKTTLIAILANIETSLNELKLI